MIMAIESGELDAARIMPERWVVLAARKSALSSFSRGEGGEGSEEYLEGRVSQGQCPGLANEWVGSKSDVERSRLAHASTTGERILDLVR